MAYVNEQNAGHRLVSFLFGATGLAGPVGALLEKVVEREGIQAGVNNSNVANPVNFLGARAVLRFLDTAAGIAETASPSNITVNIKDAAANSGSVVLGPMVAGSVRHTMERNVGGFPVEQDFEHQGSSLTYTPTI